MNIITSRGETHMAYLASACPYFLLTNVFLLCSLMIPAHPLVTYRASCHAPNCLQLAKDSCSIKFGWGKHDALGGPAILSNHTQVPFLCCLCLDLVQLPTCRGKEAAHCHEQCK